MGLEEEIVDGNSQEGPTMAELVAQGLRTGLCEDQWGSSEEVEVLGASQAGVGAFPDLCRVRNRKDSIRKHLGILSELNCSQYLLLLLQPGNKSATKTILLPAELFTLCLGFVEG